MSRTTLNILLAGVAVGLGAALALRQGALGPVAVAPLPRPETTVAEERLSIPRPPRAAVAAISSRPLFSESRRPPAAPTPARPLPPPEIRLMGVALAGGGGAAILADPAGAQILARVGDRVGGWRLTRIDAEAVVLERDGREVVARLDGEEESAAPAGRRPARATGRPSAPAAPRSRAERQAIREPD